MQPHAPDVKVGLPAAAPGGQLSKDALQQMIGQATEPSPNAGAPIAAGLLPLLLSTARPVARVSTVAQGVHSLVELRQVPNPAPEGHHAALGGHAGRTQ